MASIREYRDQNGKLKSFYIKVYRGRDISGKQLRPFNTTFTVDPSWTEKKAKKEAEKYALLYEEECKRGKISISDITLSEYMIYTIELKNSRGQYKKRSYALSKSIAKRISDRIGYIKLRELSVKDLNDLYSALSTHLSAKTVSEYHSLIRTTLKQAVKEGVITQNVALYAEKPKIVKKEVNYYQKEDIINILKAVESESLFWRTFVYILIFSGARRGEIVGLKWENVDFDNNRVFINSTILYTKEDGVFEDSTKTAKSTRWITLPDSVIELLKELKKESYTSKYVFSNEFGVIHPDSVVKYLKRLEKKYDLPHLNCHAFRHTMASMLYNEGIDPVSISNRLGHARVSITSDIYAHKIAQYDEKNAKTLENLYFVEK